MIEYREERLTDIAPEMNELVLLDWQEMEGEGEEPCPNWALYNELEKKEVLHTTTVRSNGDLVGYCINILHYHLHYKKKYISSTDAFFLHKDHRKGLIGYKLLKKSFNLAKQRGVNCCLITVKLSQDYPMLLKRLGFKPMEKIYSMEV